MQYIVKAGDTPWGIAQRYLGNGSQWQQIYQGDPTKLQVGTTLNIPQSNNPADTTTNNSPQYNPPISEIDAQKQELAKLQKELQDKLALAERVKAAHVKSNEQIPQWVIDSSSPADAENQWKQKRIQELEGTAFDPGQTFQEIWDTEYKNSKLPTLETQINKAKTDLTKAEGKINENPWLSEAGRVGRTKKLYEMAQNDIKNLTDQYNQELERVKFAVEGKTKSGINRSNAAIKELDYLQKHNVPESQWPANSPTSYKEYILAGGNKTGVDYAAWLKQKASNSQKQKTFITPPNKVVRQFQTWFSKNFKGTAPDKYWNEARNNWVAAGYDPTQFDRWFATFSPNKEFGAPTSQDKALVREWLTMQPDATKEDFDNMEKGGIEFYLMLQKAKQELF